MIQQDHLQIFDLTLTVRSPLFIGDGRMYTKAEYLYCTRNGRASLLDEQKFFTFLTDRGLIDRYIQFMLCNQSNLRDFLTEDCGISDADLNALTRYTIEAGDAVTNPPKNLYTFQRDAHGKAYIPGSSLKGALRTVWLLQAVRADQSTGHSLASDDNAAFPEEQYVNQLHLRLQKRSTVYSGGFRSPTVRPSRMSKWLFAENSMYFRTVPFQRTVRKAFPCSGNARSPALRFILS